ncbi:NIPSNAP family protein [Pendulispora albinea]|uniref:NIPSNAP family protein n=1 Tax=Pendulispora albinea TaxID=2741071 RepID=A0ABZ2LY12_9BACT
MLGTLAQIAGGSIDKPDDPPVLTKPDTRSVLRCTLEHLDAMPTYSPIIELRQYTLRPGTRDTMIALFDREFVETQEATGMKIIGQFRDLDDPNQFVWLRGFDDMAARRNALTAFYDDGTVWKEHRDAARATMVDTNNAILLRPAREGSGFELPDGDRAPRDASDAPDAPARGLLSGTLLSLDAPIDSAYLDFFERELEPVLNDCGASMAAVLVSEESPNTYPPLPVREGNWFAWFSRFPDHAAHEAYLAALEQSPRRHVFGRHAVGKPQVLRLAPTARSLLRG